MVYYIELDESPCPLLRVPALQGSSNPAVFTAGHANTQKRVLEMLRLQRQVTSQQHDFSMEQDVLTHICVARQRLETKQTLQSALHQKSRPMVARIVPTATATTTDDKVTMLLNTTKDLSKKTFNSAVSKVKNLSSSVFAFGRNSTTNTDNNSNG
jgi:hypothetical protein